MTDSKTMKPVMTESEYAKITEVNDKSISFRLYDTPELEDNWRNGREFINSAPNEHWSIQLAKDGFEPVSIKSLEQDNSESQKSKPIFGEQLGFGEEKKKPSTPDYEFGEQLSFFDDEAEFFVPEKETVFTNMTMKYFKLCEPYFRDASYEISNTEDGVILLTDNYNYMSAEIKRADSIVSEINLMTTYGYTEKQLDSLHELIVKSVDAGRNALVREAFDTRFNEQQITDIAKLVSASLNYDTKNNYKAIFMLKNQYIQELNEAEKTMKNSEQNFESVRTGGPEETIEDIYDILEYLSDVDTSV